ncbi:hypothetical protein MML48_3g00011868 [Holotrichia oblita]|uniref:Uncharacterized protein n=1 Tax=Holotrichia oblita TaxID=644536 RepID=A0ACB9TE49_HOLOL|nr:hypothetical protein MML48_3g00011868 [Holotrichia oblita]
MKRENEGIRKEMKQVSKHMEIMEKTVKENNVVVSGFKIVTDDGNKLREGMSNMLKEHLNVDVKPKQARKLGEKTCLLELSSEDKELIMQNKSKLRRVQNERIFINEDLTNAELKMRKVIRAKAQEERAKGREFKIGFRKLIVDKREWRWDRNKRTLEEVVLKN